MSELIKNTVAAFKVYRDAAGIVYVRVNSLFENPAVEVTFNNAEVLEQVTVATDNVREIITSLETSEINLLLSVTFSDGKSFSESIYIPTEGQSLAQTNEELNSSFNFNYDSSAETYSFTDSIYYSEVGADIYDSLNIVPSSNNPHLDTSSNRDFYYTSSGAAAYIASNDLQNTFLRDLGYDVAGSKSNDLGKFRGGIDNNSLLNIVSTPADPTEFLEAPLEGLEGPLVSGGIFVVSTKAGSPFNSVCVDPAADNYYLKGCVGEAYPCTDSGTTHADDCDGNTLTSSAINSFTNLDGGCCTYSSGCDGFSAQSSSTAATTTTGSDGTITITITGGTANFTIIVEQVNSLNGTIYNSGNPNTISGISAQVHTVTGLPGGDYLIDVTDSTGGEACSTRFETFVDASTTDPVSTYGCKSVSGAINYDNSVTTHDDNLCVFCDAVSGELMSGSSSFPAGQLLGKAFEFSGLSASNATSSPSGSSQNDGFIGFPGITFNSYPLPGSSTATFDSAAEFTTSNQSSPWRIRLYKLNSGFVVVGGSNPTTLSDIISNSSVTSTVNNSSGGAHTFIGLAAGHYVVAVQYDNDGTLDGDDEVEQCYAYQVTSVGQGGCTDPNSSNYNASATFDDGSCIPPSPSNALCGDFHTAFKVECDPGNNFSDFKITQSKADFLAANPGIDNVLNNGYTLPNNFSTYYTGQFLQASNHAVVAYVLNELLCGPACSNIVTFLTTTAAPVTVCTNGTAAPVPNTPTNGHAGLHFHRPSYKLTYSDGTVYTWDDIQAVHDYTNSGAIYDVWSPQSLITCPLIAQHGDPVSLEVIQNYGNSIASPDVWTQTTSSQLTTFTATEIADFNACCGITPPPPVVPGCTDPQAINYNIDCNGNSVVATVDDGCCTYAPPPRPGCTDPTATNYDPTATVDDGSCVYPQAGSWFCTGAQALAKVGPNQSLPSPCIYVATDPNGFATQQICEDDCQPATNDCSFLGDWAATNSITFNGSGTSTNSTSVFNATTGLCDTNNDGTITVTLPDATQLNLDAGGDIYFTWFLYTAADPVTNAHTYKASWLNAGTALYTASVLIFQGVANQHNNGSQVVQGAQLLTDTYGDLVITGLPNKLFNLEIHFWANNVNYPTELNDACGELLTYQTVGLDPCTGPCVYGCTDSTALNFDPNATCDDGSCIYPPPPPPNGCLCANGTYDPTCCPPNPPGGCTDPNAINYNPNAVADDGSCEYPIVHPPCIPPDHNRYTTYLDDCLARVGHKFYTKHITGMSQNCSNMEAWKIVIIREILGKLGLPCIYNCNDPQTPSIDDATFDCKAEWVAQGSNFWNPTTAPSFGIGDVVKRANGGLGGVIFVAISNSGLTVDPFANYISGNFSGWKRCQDILPLDTENKDYLEKFLRFAFSYCKDCEIPPYRVSKDNKVGLRAALNIGGTTITNNGATFTTDSDEY